MPGEKNRLKSAVAFASEAGWPNAALYWLNRIFDRSGGWVRIDAVYLYSQHVGITLLPAGRGRSITVRALAADAAVALGVPVRPDLLARRRNPEVLCLAAVKDDTVLGYHWLNFGAHDDEMVRCRFVSLPEGRAAWGIELNILPAHRGGLTYARIWDETHKLLRERGALYATSYIIAWNIAGIAAEEKLGGQRLGRLVFVRIGSWQVMLAGVSPYVHLSIGKANVPVVRVPPLPGAGAKR